MCLCVDRYAVADRHSPLSGTLPPASPYSTKASSGISPLGRSEDVNPFDEPVHTQSSLIDEEPDEVLGNASEKNLSFLLDSAIYHPLSAVDIPGPFRKPFPGPPAPGTSTSQALKDVESLVQKCDFLGAAHLAAVCLTSGLVKPTDHVSIFRLLAIRYSCLELVGQLLLAAQETKALEDLSSEFYYIAPEVTEAEIEAHHGQRPLAEHIMPFSLRVQTIRLQNIGFSDPRRGVTMLYELGLEVRVHLASSYTTETERAEWSRRLELLGMHVVNALIELGDVDCAQRTLAQSKPAEPKALARWTSRMTLMLLKLGQINEAQKYVNQLQSGDPEKVILSALLAVADGRFDEATEGLEGLANREDDSRVSALAKQNLAVALLYLGRIAEAQKLLEGLIEEGRSFPALTVNLTTIFDLTSDRSRDQKVALVAKLASSQTQKRPFTNADFKL